MHKTKLLTVSIGIPAHNEAGNITYLLRSILLQKNLSFTLNKIYVLCDGCTDDTALKAGLVAKLDQRIIVINDGKKNGKTSRLNQLYKLNTSDLVLNLDGDIMLDGDHFIENLVQRFVTDMRALVVAANLEPITPDGIVGRISYSNCKLWDETRHHINGGDHIANLFGAATMITKEFSHTFSYPAQITCDEEYLYILAKQKNGFRFCLESRAFFLPANTLRELRSQATRFRNERYLLEAFFGSNITKLHDVPVHYKVKALRKRMIEDPFFTILALIFNYTVSGLPSRDPLNGKGMWEQATSTKTISRYLFKSL